jgi:hypothetical protein
VAEVVIQTPWTRNEFVRARWLSKRLTWIDVICFVGFALLIWKNGGALLAACIISVVGYSFVRLIAMPIMHWNAYRDLKEQPIFTVDDQGVKVVVAADSTFRDWSFYKSAIETRNFYSLKGGVNASRFTIAKRMVSNEIDEATLRALMRAHTNAHLRPNAKLDTVEFN